MIRDHEPPEHPRSQPGYVDVDRLENSDRLVAVISQRVFDGALTFGIFREFDRHGTIGRTGFVPEQLGESYTALLHLTLQRIAQLRAQATCVVHTSPSSLRPEDKATWCLRDQHGTPMLPYPMGGWRGSR
jgi:hypothetical protein